MEYGNDVEGSGFCKAGRDARDPLGKTDWNLQVWRTLPRAAPTWRHVPCRAV